MNKPSILMFIENMPQESALVLVMDNPKERDAMQDFWEYISDRTFLASQGIS